MASSRVAIGIDLGTTYSCVAIYCKGRIADDEAGAGVIEHGRGYVKVIQNDSGYNITPSCVAFTDTDRLIGDAAKMQIIQNPQNTIFGIKRIMGRKFDDESIQDDIERWPFTVAEKNGKPIVMAEHENQVKEFTPEQISAMVLGKMKEIAEVHCINGEVTDAVVTVPAYFDNSQRQATVDAGKIAGLNVLQILNEPTAAALAYGIERNVDKKTNVLIYDLGGGTFDVSVVEIQNGTFDVIASGGDVHLGGEDFDMLLVDHFISEIKLKYKKDISDNKRSVQRLKKACEKAKRKLSSAKRADIDIDYLFGETDYNAKLSQALLDMLCNDLFKKTIEIVADTLEKARMDKDELDEIVLVGGSTRIVKIQSLLNEFFEGRQLNKTINPDEAVAYGAAVKAALLTGQITPEDVRVLDVIPMSLGIETLGGMSTIIERNTKIPAKRARKNYTTCRDNQPTMTIQVFEGENMDTAGNHLLGSFTLANIQKAPRAVPSIDVTFAVDANGILKVSAIDQATKSKNQVTIKSSTGRLGKWAMKRMIAEAKDFGDTDRRRQECDAARNSLEVYCFKTKIAVEDDGQAEGRITDDEREEVLEACNAVLEWLEENENATKEQVEEKREKFSHLCQNFLDQIP